MTREEIVHFIEQQKLVAIVRLKESSFIMDVVKNLVEGGVKVLEITSNTPNYIEGITKARKAFPNVLIGVGTATNASIAKDAILAGAQFIVTPNTNQEIVRIAHQYEVPVLMGALSPTEISMAVKFGADIIKLFPAGNLGLDYFKSIKGPYNNQKFFPVGGIGLNNIQDWLAAGAIGVGVGSTLIKTTNKKESIQKIKNTAMHFIKLIKEVS